MACKLTKFKVKVQNSWWKLQCILYPLRSIVKVVAVYKVDCPALWVINILSWTYWLAMQCAVLYADNTECCVQTSMEMLKSLRYITVINQQKSFKVVMCSEWCHPCIISHVVMTLVSIVKGRINDEIK